MASKTVQLSAFLTSINVQFHTAQQYTSTIKMPTVTKAALITED